MTKWLALFLMILDHIGYVFDDRIPSDVYIFLRLLGRLSFPIFVYYIVLGVNRTSDKYKYLLRMVGLAIVSQVITNYTFPQSDLNILFSFSLMIIYSIFYKKKYGFFAVIILFLLSGYTEYSYAGFTIFIALNYLYNLNLSHKQLLSTLAIFLTFLPSVLLKETITLQLFAGFSGLTMFTPKFEKRILSKNIERIVFYIYYPAQWIIFYLILNYM